MGPRPGREEHVIRTEQSSPGHPTDAAAAGSMGRPALSTLLAVVLAAGAGGLWALVLGALAGAVLYGTTLGWLSGFAVAGFDGFPLPALVHSQLDGPFALAAPLGGFGEYIPGREILERVTDLTALVPRDAIPGEGTAVLESPVEPLGVVISYEVLFADRAREAVIGGGQIVLVPTNAASYVTEDVPAIEVAGARLRALEFGRTVVQSAPTGYSVVVTPDGRVLAQSGLGDPALLRETVPLRTGLTPYARTGDTPTLILAVLVLLTPIARHRTGRGAGE